MRHMTVFCLLAILCVVPALGAELEVPGLDRAWAGRNEVVAVKGGMAAYVTLLPYDGFDPQALCQALAEKWADTAG